jgi:hypothetical protein
MEHYQDCEIEFQNEAPGESPHPWKVVVFQHGTNLADCIAKARKQFKLGVKWEVTSFKVT